MIRSSSALLFVASSLLAIAAPAVAAAKAAQPSPVVADPVTDGSATALTVADADTLKPGQYLWHPELASSGPVQMVVDLMRQVAFVYRGDTLIGVTTVSTGRDGYDTPLGTYPILQKQVEHRSNLYNAAPMPYMQRLTWDGVALHAGGVPGYRSSHGCVHLPDALAKALYEETALGGEVAITEGGTTMADALPVVPDTAPADPNAPTLDDAEQTPAVVASSAP